MVSFSRFGLLMCMCVYVWVCRTRQERGWCRSSSVTVRTRQGVVEEAAIFSLMPEALASRTAKQSLPSNPSGTEGPPFATIKFTIDQLFENNNNKFASKKNAQNSPLNGSKERKKNKATTTKYDKQANGSRRQNPSGHKMCNSLERFRRTINRQNIRRQFFFPLRLDRKCRLGPKMSMFECVAEPLERYWGWPRAINNVSHEITGRRRREKMKEKMGKLKCIFFAIPGGRLCRCCNKQ